MHIFLHFLGLNLLDNIRKQVNSEFASFSLAFTNIIFYNLNDSTYAINTYLDVNRKEDYVNNCIRIFSICLSLMGDIWVKQKWSVQWNVFNKRNTFQNLNVIRGKVHILKFVRYIKNSIADLQDLSITAEFFIDVGLLLRDFSHVGFFEIF